MFRTLIKWLPWSYIIKRSAQSQGFIDPNNILARFNRFAQPAEVKQPIELLRAGVLFHARGLINTQAIQHNLDWIWPYWISKQFDPNSEAFLPRSFSATHVNLTHRNWTAIGIPDYAQYPIVDPRGLITPFWDGWSLDFWIISTDGQELIPAKQENVRQELTFTKGMEVSTTTTNDNLSIHTTSCMDIVDNKPTCIISVCGHSSTMGMLVVSLRPYNPEGISFISDINIKKEEILVNNKERIILSAIPDQTLLSNYQHGDVYSNLREYNEEIDSSQISCPVGMATAAACYTLKPTTARTIHIEIPLEEKSIKEMAPSASLHWEENLASFAQLDVPDDHYVFLYNAAIRTLLLLAPQDIYPGPYTYKRFWFRDAVYMLHAMLSTGGSKRTKRILAQFPGRQQKDGYFVSQEGEWDSNGQVLWIASRFFACTGEAPFPNWENSLYKASQWIAKKRTSLGVAARHAGLLPAGFSAEHFGPSDFYYWDDIWSIAGLEQFASICSDQHQAKKLRSIATELRLALQRSIASAPAFKRSGTVPTSPYRRMDSAAIAILAAVHPAQVWDSRDESLLATIEFLLEKCIVSGVFFQDMIHSGLNAYLTLHIAQALLRARDNRYLSLIDRIAQLSSSTGQWPEAIHPRTLGGCMGDGHHGWASAEWILMMQSLFLISEKERLLLLPGIPDRWLVEGAQLSLGPLTTEFGTISISAQVKHSKLELNWQAKWLTPPAQMLAALPNRPTVILSPQNDRITLEL